MKHFNSTMTVYTCLTTVVLLITTTAASAQPASEPQRRYSLFSEADNKPKDTEVRLESEITTTITLPGINISPCQAQVELAYSQRNTVARVSAEVKSSQCPVVSGQFEIVASVRDDAGQLTRLAFPETFLLDGVTEMSFTRDYPIGENVTLSSMRTSGVECGCLVDSAQE